MKNILIWDDDKEIVEAIEIYLSGDGYKIFSCYNGKDAYKCILSNKIDLAIMDIMMPGDDGIKTVSKIREKFSLPIIFVSAKSEDNDKILGLNIGADDYITKPFNPLELQARVKNLLRRAAPKNAVKEHKILKNGDLTLDGNKKVIFLEGNILKTTPIEYNLLDLFMHNIGSVLSSKDIYTEVWKQEEPFNVENTVAVHIRHLREKIEKNSKNPKYIKVVWGIGYKMDAIK